ncbi:MAG TPA: cytochrome ubiquinol oxidase subunit I [Candidatus Dormibacteraeota bacterium]|jgi:cytochrome d ubiquinol oxidase subunit I|nr:cytochrome ubiquinol oxidase subunit I [Candidatus Dormibacteraeota bacterium]
MNEATLARATMGMSLGFHIVFASLGVGLPVLLSVAEGVGLLRHDATWVALARRWATSFAILFAVGAVSGTVLSFELGLLFPGFMAFSGSMIGLPFSAEGFAFFLEAIFLGLYIYGWNRLSPLAHWLCSIPIAVSGAASALFVVMVNSWMNTPAGFKLDHGRVVDINPLAAAFNPSVGTEDPHMLFSAYTVTGFLVAAVYAAGMLRRRTFDTWHRRGLTMGMAMGMVAILLAGIWGDSSARFLYKEQPIKFAALEGLFQTQRDAPIHILGIPLESEHKTVFAIEIPDGLSLLAAFNPDAQVRGLDSFPANDLPNPIIVHLSFDTMVGLSTLVGLLSLLFWFLYWRRRGPPLSRLILLAVALAGPAMVVALEAGWFVTEFGRQPWVVYGIIRTNNSATDAPGLGPFFGLFLLIYVVLAVTTAQLLLYMARRERRKDAEETH